MSRPVHENPGKVKLISCQININMASVFSQLVISGQLSYHLRNHFRILPGFHGELLGNSGSFGIGEFHRGSGRGRELHLGFCCFGFDVIVSSCGPGGLKLIIIEEPLLQNLNIKNHS